MNVSNHLQLIGQVEAPPIYLTTEQGMDFTLFYLLTQRSPSAIKPTTLDRHRCISWGRLACSLHEHLNTGNRLAISGELCYRIIPQQGRQPQTIVEVHVQGFSFLGQGNLQLLPKRRLLAERALG